MRTLPSAAAASLASLAILVSACSDASDPTTPVAANSRPSLALTSVQGTGQPAALVSRLNPAQCLDVAGGSATPGTAVTVYGCHGGANQTFTWQANGEIRFGGVCVDAFGGAGNNGDRVVVWTCNGGANQRWSATSTGQIKGINGRCIDIPNGNSANGTRVIIWDCHSAPNQQWDERQSGNAVPAPAPAPAPDAGNAVPVYPGQSVQAAVNANPAGTAFVLKAGTHVRQSVVPKSGNSFTGEAGTILDGQNAVAYAFQQGGTWGAGTSYPGNVRISRLVIKNYNPPEHFGAITGGGYTSDDSSIGWTIEECEIAYNGTGGIRTGTRMTIRGNNIHHNGQVGIAGPGRSILIENNEIAYSNYQDAHGTTYGNAGLKLVETTDIVARGNFVHHNHGNGFWTDLNNVGALYENNRVEDNQQAGIFHEISYRAIIRNNQLSRNGSRSGWMYGGGITVSGSPDVEIYGNTLTNNFNGITALQHNRAEQPKYGPYEVNNLYVHDNKVTQSSSYAAGLALDNVANPDSYFTSRNNRFVNNTYYLQGAGAHPFVWKGGVQTDASWRGYGQDAGGAFYR